MLRILALILLLASSPVPAGEPPQQATEASVEKLLELMQADQMLEQVRAQTQAAMRQAAVTTAAKPLDARTQAILDKYLVRLGDLMFGPESLDRVHAMMVTIYTSQFSEREVQDMIVFYRSETGQAMTRKMPQVMQQSMQLAMAWMQDLQPAMTELMDQMKQEIQEAAEQPVPVTPRKQAL